MRPSPQGVSKNNVYPKTLFSVRVQRGEGGGVNERTAIFNTIAGLAMPAFVRRDLGFSSQRGWNSMGRWLYSEIWEVRRSLAAQGVDCCPLAIRQAGKERKVRGGTTGVHACTIYI